MVQFNCNTSWRWTKPHEWSFKYSMVELNVTLTMRSMKGCSGEIAWRDSFINECCQLTWRFWWCSRGSRAGGRWRWSSTSMNSSCGPVKVKYAQKKFSSKEFKVADCRMRIDPLAEAGIGDGLVNGEPGGRAEVLLGGGQRATPRYLKPRSGGAEVVGWLPGTQIECPTLLRWHLYVCTGDTNRITIFWEADHET